MLTAQQAAWVETQRRALRIKPRRAPVVADSELRQQLSSLIHSTRFELGVIALIGANTMVLSLEHLNMSPRFGLVLQTFDRTFTVLFAVEATLKIAALTPKVYFKDHWNIFDFVIVVAAIAMWVLRVGTGAGALRIIRIARIFRLIKQFKGLRMLFVTLVLSVPTMCNVAALGVLLFFMFAVMGVKLFGKVKIGEPQEQLSEHANFKSFGSAMMTLLRMSTGALVGEGVLRVGWGYRL